MALAKELHCAPFNYASMTEILWNPRELEARAKAASILEREPLMLRTHYDLAVKESRRLTMRKILRRMQMSFENADVERWFDYFVSGFDASFGMRRGVHTLLFMNTLQGQGTPEQAAKWMDDAQQFKIIGCFGMTELGKGSNIAGFETTATYVPDAEEFEIHSPTITSTKWWIGMAGETATHCTVFARLIVGGKDVGVHIFIVQLRNRTGKPMPGVTVGDVGEKMGRNGLDNGYIRFNKVRIPRENMLMRWAQVLPDGTYKPAKQANLSYATLLAGRVMITQVSTFEMQRAAIIAVRFSALRAPFDMPILDYQSHHARLFPIIASGYAFHFTILKYRQAHESLVQTLLAGKGDLAALAEFHASIAGLKAVATWVGLGAIDTARQCCGGLGYSAYSAFPSMLGDFTVWLPGEGDNVVMCQQSARFLLRCLQRGSAALPQTCKYLAESLPERLSMPDSNSLTADRELLHMLAKAIARASLSALALRLQREIGERGNAIDAWNACQVDAIETAKRHTWIIILECFAERVHLQPNSLEKNVLALLDSLLSLQFIIDNLAFVLQHQMISSEQSNVLAPTMRLLQEKLRPSAVGLVEAFAFPDWLVNSTLGAADGEVYGRVLARAENATAKLREGGRTPYWDELVKPLLRPKL